MCTITNKATTTQTFEDKARQYAEVESAFDEASGPNEVGSPTPQLFKRKPLSVSF